MANLGIKIKVDFGEANRQLDAFERKWKELETKDLKLKIKIDSHEVDNLKKTIDKIDRSTKEGIKLKVDTTNATSNIKTFRDNFDALKKEIEKGLDIKLGSNNLDSNGMDSVIKNSQNLAKGLQAAHEATNSMHSSYKNMNSTVGRMNNENLQGVKEVSNEYGRMASKRSEMSRANLNNVKKENAALKEMVSFIKEIGSLEKTKVGKPADEQAVIQDRVSLLRKELQSYKSDYEKAFGRTADNNWIVKNAQDLADYNLKIKEVAQSTKDMANDTKALIAIENEKHALLMKQDSVGEKESAIIKEQISLLDKKGDKIRENNKEIANNEDYNKKIGLLKEENELIQKRANANREDKASAENSKAIYKELLDYQKQIFDIEKKIANYQAEVDNKTIDAKGRQKLEILEKEKAVIQDIIQLRIKEDGDKLLSSEKELLEVKKKQQSTQLEIVQAEAKAKAQAKEQVLAYEELLESMKQVDKLNDLIATSGRKQTEEIKDAIAAEEKKQNAIRETIRIRGLESKELEQQVSEERKLQRERTETNSKISRGKDRDERGYTGVFADVFDPRNIYENGKQAAMTMFESVRELDTAFTDIAKVADVPAEVLEEFSRNIFDQASAVGLAADQYAVSVERWLTTGRSLEESQNIAQVSSMGGFVGNIGEEEMVKYMSVPLQAFKKDMIQSEDIVNSMNEVANNNAVTMDDLGMAYERAAQTAAMSGESFSELTGLIAGANANTMAGGEKIGTALKAIDLNFNKISAQTTKQDTDRMAFFESIGVQLKDKHTKQLRSTYDIVKDISEVWDKLDSDQRGKANLYAAGKNHASVFTGMISGWKDVEKARMEAEGQVGLIDKQSGSAYKEFETQKQSVEFKTQTLKNSWNEFLNVVAGGREGVNGVLDIMIQLVDKATELAENDGFMDMAKGIAKLIAVTSGTVGVSKLFKMFGDGAHDIGRSLKVVGGLFSKGNLTKGADAASDSFSSIMKNSKGMGKITGTVGLLGKSIGSLVPIIGGVIGVLTIMDAMGLDVFGAIGKGIDAVVEKFDTAEEKADKFNKKFVDRQKELQKDMSENKFLNGTIEGMSNLGQTYDELVKKKEKLKAETGDENELSFSPEEFSSLKAEYDKMAESLGIDVRLTMNDYEDIKRKMELLMSYKEKLTATELDEADKVFEETLKPKNLDKDLKAWEKEKEQATKDRDWAVTKLETEKEYGIPTDKEIKALEKNIADAEANLKKVEDYYNSEAGVKARAAEAERLAGVERYKDEFGKKVEDGQLTTTTNGKQKATDGWIKMDQESKERHLAATIAYGKDMMSETDKLQKYLDEFNRSGSIFNSTTGDNAAIEDDGLMNLIRDITQNQNLSSDPNDWEASGVKFEEVLAQVEGMLKKASEESGKFKDSLVALADEAGMSGEEIENMLTAFNEGGVDFVKTMASFGTDGASLLGLDATFLKKFGDQWAEQAISIQTELDKLTGEQREIAINYKLMDESGLLNGDMMSQLSNIPEEINTKFNIIDDEGNVNIQNTVQMLEKLNGMDFSFKAEVLDIEGNVMLEKFVAKIKELEGTDELQEFYASFKAEGVEEVEKGKEALDKVEDKEVSLKVNTPQVGAGAIGLLGIPEELPGPSVKFGADTSEYDDAKIKVDALNEKGKTNTSFFKGNTSDFDTDKTYVAETKDTSSTHTFYGKVDASFINALNQAANAGGKKGGGGSVGIIDRNMGRSFSASISSAIGKSANVGVSGKSRSTSTQQDKSINSDVWRYWSKELFKGLPLERSMENLEIAISKASDNYAKLIPLYKQQSSLLNQQIAFEKTMQKETQSELNEVLGKLRGKGFTTKGNQITNLGKAKSFKGDSASEIEELLNKWKSLYQGLDDITGKINSLNKDKWDVENDIKDARISQEQEKIEKSLKKTTALLTAIENHTSLMSKKESFVSDSDFELKLTVQEESSNEAKKNIGQLIDEFNRLSKTTVKYEENASDVQDELESLKTEILSNADAVIEYRESINQTKIDRLIEDYDKFNSVIQRNTDLISENIDILKEGLISGSDFGDLESSNLTGLTFNRKNSLDKQFKDRLQLEAKIDSALDAFAKRNVDRAKNVANSQLQIEKKKYNELLKMGNSFSNGKTPSYKEIGGSFDLGKMDAENNAQNKAYQEWLNKLKNTNSKYVNEFSAMRDTYDKKMGNAGSQKEKDSLTNKFVIDQLKLQEKIQSDIIALNKEAISQAKEELKNANLTTEQREQLEQSILEYQDSSIEAQNAIRDSIKSRFEFEFDLLDEMADKVAKYSEHIEHLLDISDMINSSPSDRQPLLDKIYEAKINEYYNAKKALSSLVEEQKKFTEGSLEWNLLQDKIEEVDKSMKDLTISLLESNKDVLGNQLDVLFDGIAKGALGGKTLDEWKTFEDRWMQGIEKEIELEKIRQRLLDIENNTLQGKLEALDRQEAISKKDLEYLDKQTKVLELQNKIMNLDKERSVQTLVKKDDGTWDWEYVADQTEIDKAKDELKEAEKDLEKYRREQQAQYIEDMQKAIDKAKDGGFDSTDALKQELEDIRKLYGAILTDIPDFNMGSIEEILSAYDKFLKENGEIIDDALNGTNNKEFDKKLENVGKMFETSFRNIADDLGKIIGDSLTRALNAAVNSRTATGAQGYTIQNMELSFPNVTDTTGFEDVLLDLPQVTIQKVHSK